MLQKHSTHPTRKQLDIYDIIVYNFITNEGMLLVRNFIYTKPFRAAWSAMGLADGDLFQLEKVLLADPHIGDVIEGTGGARKLRIQLEGRGKRGGGRVVYVDIFEKEHLYLLFAYPKNVQENLSAVQTAAIRKMILEIKKE